VFFGLGERKLLRFAVQLPLTITHTIGPRHKNDSATQRPLHTGIVWRHDVDAMNAQSTDACGHLRDRGLNSTARRRVEPQVKLFTGHCGHDDTPRCCVPKA
jgi:hypothetical protein